MLLSTTPDPTQSDEAGQPWDRAVSKDVTSPVDILISLQMANSTVGETDVDPVRLIQTTIGLIHVID